MPKLQNLTSREVIAFLLKIGFQKTHQEGSHVQLKRGGLRVTIPDHGKKILNIKTVYSIIRQANINKEELQNI